MKEDFWEQAEVVERFASRKVDIRLEELVKKLPGDASNLKVMDLGCASGRNSKWLFQQGFSVYGVDTSEAMLTKSRQTLQHLGLAKPEKHFINTSIVKLDMFQSASFDLIVALGIFHQLSSLSELDKAVTECARLLKPSGLCLVSNFAPGTKLPANNKSLLMTSTSLDLLFKSNGLITKEDSKTVPSRQGSETRLSVQALYQKKA